MSERRATVYDAVHWRNQLNTAQLAAANNLENYGYEIMFVREQNRESMAVYSQGDMLATINEEGDTNFRPSIFVR